MKLYEIVVMKPERIVVKTDASSSLQLGKMAHLLVDGMDIEHGIKPYLHSTRPLEDEEYEPEDAPTAA